MCHNVTAQVFFFSCIYIYLLYQLFFFSCLLSFRSGRTSGCMCTAREWNSTSSSLHMRFFSKTRWVGGCFTAVSLQLIVQIVFSIRNTCLCSVIFGQRQLGLHWRGRSSPAEERWLAPLQDHDGVQVQPPAPDHGDPSAELPEGAVVPAALHHAWEVGYASVFHICFRPVGCSSLVHLSQCWTQDLWVQVCNIWGC